MNARILSRIVLATLLAAMLLLPTAPAFGQSADQGPTASQYEDQVTQIVGGGDGNGNKPQSGKPEPALEQDIVEGLPITGLDVVALAAVALALTAMGFALLRFTAIGE